MHKAIKCEIKKRYEKKKKERKLGVLYCITQYGTIYDTLDGMWWCVARANVSGVWIFLKTWLVQHTLIKKGAQTLCAQLGANSFDGGCNDWRLGSFTEVRYCARWVEKHVFLEWWDGCDHGQEHNPLQLSDSSLTTQVWGWGFGLCLKKLDSGHVPGTRRGNLKQ